MSSSSDSEVQLNIPPSIGQGDEFGNHRVRVQEANIGQDSDSDIELSDATHARGNLNQSKNSSASVQCRRGSSENLANLQRGHSASRFIPHNSSSYGSRRTGHGKVPSIKPDIYTGDDEWELYISHFEICAELGNWSQRDKVLTLAACLRGQARSFYVNLPDRDKHSYEIVVHELGRRFGSTRQQNVWLSRLESRKRLPGEAIAIFGDDVRRMAQRAYANLDIVAQETLALNQLYRELSPEMKYKCITGGCKTVSEAIEMIETYEGIVGEEMGKRRSTVRRLENQCVTEEDKQSAENSMLQETLEQILKQLNRMDRTRNNRNSDQNKSQPICYLCHTPGHIRRDCPRNEQRKYNSGENTARSNKTDSFRKPVSNYKHQENANPSS